MITITKDNILSYLHEKLPGFIWNEPVTISQIGDGDLGEDVEGDGYCNYIFRVSDGEKSLILKQASQILKRRARFKVSTLRNRFEYEIMKIRYDIVPQFVPKIYYGDFENNIIVMEDVSHLKLIRFQMNRNHYFPHLAEQMAHYLAATHFYASEFYLDTHEYRKMMAHFMNASMRTVMEGPVFLKIFGADDYDPACGPEFRKLCEFIRYDDNLQFQRYKLRHLFMSKCETLIHGDFHTSNIFADDENMKVIDMEYPMGAPLSYDLGFIIANIITQISSAAYRPYESNYDRKQYIAYLLGVIQSIYTYYIHYFFTYWDKDAKLEYRILPEYKDCLAKDILQECIGFAACYNFSRVCGDMDTAEFDFIKDNDARTKAKTLSLYVDKVFFEKWSTYEDISEAVDDIIYLLKRCD